MRLRDLLTLVPIRRSTPTDVRIGDWLALATATTEAILDEHRWRGELCRCGARLTGESTWRIHIGMLTARTLGADQRAARSLTTYQADRVTP